MKLLLFCIILDEEVWTHRHGEGIGGWKSRMKWGVNSDNEQNWTIVVAIRVRRYDVQEEPVPLNAWPQSVRILVPRSFVACTETFPRSPPLKDQEM